MKSLEDISHTNTNLRFQSWIPPAVSLSLFPLLLELKSLDKIRGSKSYGLSLYKSGRLSFPVSSLSEEECSLEDIVMNWKTLARELYRRNIRFVLNEIYVTNLVEARLL